MTGKLRWQFFFVQALTLGRMPLIFVFLAVCLFGPKPPGAFWFSVAFWAMILSAVTDLFDGYFARKFHVETRLGAYADPLTDKVFYLTTFPTLAFLAALDGQHYGHAQLLLGLTILFLLRDQWVSFLRSIGAIYKVDAKANWSGKARTVISFPVICAIYYYLQAPKDWWLQVPPSVIYTCEIATMAINLISMWVYTAYYWPWIRKECQLSDNSPDNGDNSGD